MVEKRLKLGTIDFKDHRQDLILKFYFLFQNGLLVHLEWLTKVWRLEVEIQARYRAKKSFVM